MTPLINIAHSARDEYGPQTYEDHILGMKCLLRKILEDESEFCHLEDSELEQLFSAIESHDMGKLTDNNQKVLRGEEERNKLPDNHVDIGTMHEKQNGRYISALLVSAHHRGLPNITEEIIKKPQLSLIYRMPKEGLLDICIQRLNDGH